MFIALITLITLVAFAANSILCRMALAPGLIDPISFTSLRLLSGAALLVPLAGLRFRAGPSQAAASPGNWPSALALFAYAICFSLAYVRVDAGIGALILFGAVQTTMVGWGLRSGEQPHRREWLGLVLAIGGLIYLLSPGRTAPDVPGALLMAVAGLAWGIYSLRGRGAASPVRATAGNFLRTTPFAIVASLLAISALRVEAKGALLAVVSGTMTSAIGYVIWYRALRGLTATRAALVQLLVPVLAAFAGVLFLAESLSLRLALASALILGGVALAIGGRRR
jgi:drug/metabolite transporter (DMT)-like permease